MPREQFVEVGALSLDANPHPPGVYVRLLRRAAGFLVKARASDYAKITEPKKSDRYEHVYTGRILVWTEIDIKGAWIDLQSEEELARELKRQISIPEHARPNFRTFNYIFDDRKHLFYFETRNEFNQKLGPTTARRLIAQMLSHELLGFNEPEVEVSIVPDEGAVDRILALPGLRVLEMRVARPNADVSSPQARKRVFAELDKLHAQRMERRYVKSGGAETLTPTPEVRELAEVAADTGYLRGEGRDLNDKRVELSTENDPRRWYVSMDAGGSFLSRLASKIKLF
jgi:hypothetical protein